jgi:hypothetical protein
LGEVKKEFSHSRKDRGAALVLTLAILVIATILVVGFVASMRTERQAAASMANNMNAAIIAQAAIDHATSILDKNIPQPVPPGGSIANPTNWIINPGLLTTVKGTNTPVQIPLSSNPSAAYASTNQDAELNVPLISGGGYTILPTSDSMRVAWISVVKDPTIAAGSTNQISARYAFWMDDETAKININTAYGKPGTLDFTKLTPGTIAVNSATYPLGHPSSVNLDIFTGVDQATLATAVGQQNGLPNIDSIKTYITSGSPDTFLGLNKFSLTTSSRSPEFNVFGKPRLYFLRSIVSQTLGYPMFQYFRDKDAPPYFPADENAQASDRHSTYYAAAAISGYLNRNDWPGMPARSFVDKWGGNAAAQREADQVAWNLLSLGSFAAGDFTGSSASGHYYELANAANAGETGFVSINKPNKDPVVGSLSNKAIVPAFPLGLINEVSVVISPESYTIADGSQKYRLHVSLNIELWLPPGYPTFDFAQSPTTIAMTYLRIQATQAAPGTANALQEDAKYVDRSASPNDNGIRKLWISNNTGTINPGQYLTLSTILPCYVRNTAGFSDGAVGAEDFASSGMITLNFRMRLFSLTTQSGTKRTYQLVPVWDTHDPGTTAAPTTWDPPPPATPPACLAPPADDPKDYIEFAFQLDPSSFSSGEVITRSLEVADPRLGGLARVWQQAPHFAEPSTQNADTMGAINNATTAAGYDTKKIAFADLGQTGLTSSHPSTGFLSFVPTGMQRGLPGSTLKFQPSASSSELPDWLLLDLVAPSVTASNYTTMSYMNSTAGMINVNGQLNPSVGTFSRWQPLQALFENMPGVSGNSAPSTVVKNILNHTTTGTDFGATGVYDYPGEICEITGVADSGATDWDKEVLIRNMASSLTTKSNVFSVWGVAQTVKKNPANTNAANQGKFETKAGGAAADDVVTGEKRFEAILERYVWPGKDNIAGNGNVSAPGGNYNQLSGSRSQPGQPPPYGGGVWEKLDGPDAPTYPIAPNTDPWITSAPNYSNSTIELANNPARAEMKYRVIYFKYLTE